MLSILPFLTVAAAVPVLTSHQARSLHPDTYWATTPKFSNMSEFKVTSFAAGATNLAIMSGSPAAGADGSASNMQEAFSTFTTNWNESVNSLQILYPKGSNAPRNDPQGGTEFYAQPLDLTTANNVSLQYTVYFPSDFDFVKGGKLPGLHGGHKGCSGGNAAADCFSTRMMWRKDGEGELYLYVPKDKQTPALCNTPPKSICSSDWGLSIGRGAWKFPRGEWTTIRQDIWLNTPGQNDGGFNIWINGQLLIASSEVRYRENAASCSIDTLGAGQEAPFSADANAVSSSVATTMTSSDISSISSSVTSLVIVAAASTSSSTSMTFDDGSYKWSAPLDPTPTMVKRDVSDPFLLAAPSPSPTTVATSSESPTSSTEPLPTPTPSTQASRDCSIGFIGLFFSTFFGGHTADWSPSADQYTYFKEFAMWRNA